MKFLSLDTGMSSRLVLVSESWLFTRVIAGKYLNKTRSIYSEEQVGKSKERMKGAYLV